MYNINKLLVLCFVAFTSVTIDAYRVFDVDGVKTILALDNENISIVCKTGVPMAYCGFIQPSGKRLSFSGLSLSNGQCAVNIRATSVDSGDWTCHIGKRTIGVEILQKIRVRVVKQIAAIQPNVTAVHGKDVTLTCITAAGLTPLSYCRFEPPNGSPFSIDSAIKPDKAILGKYFYPPNNSLDRGDCAVTIRKVKYTDVGAWTCGAGLEDGKEHTDLISLQVEGLYTMSTASTTGITFGAVGIAAFLVILGIIAWKKRRFLGTAERSPEAVEVHELREMAYGPRPDTPGSQRTPQPSRSVPSVVVQSPSEPRTPPIST